MSVRTHLEISSRWVGTPVALVEGCASARLETRAEMAADARGLVHGGFIFGLADYAAMLAVNDPNVVLGAAETRFLKPVRVGDVAVATAKRSATKGRKHTVEVRVCVGEVEVFQGTFVTFVLDEHVFGPEPDPA